MRKFLILSQLLICIVLINICGCTVNDNYINSTSINTGDYSNVPTEYRFILTDFSTAIRSALSNSFEEDMNNGKFVSPDKNFTYEWQAMLINLTDGLNAPSYSSFGYILKDINEDGIPELFLMRNDYTILAVFTSNNNSPQLLGAFWSKNKAVMLDNNQLYTLTSGGAQHFEYAIWTLDNNSQLSKYKNFGSEGDSYYESINNNNVIISETKFEELLSLYPFVITDNWKKETFNRLK